MKVTFHTTSDREWRYSGWGILRYSPERTQEGVICGTMNQVVSSVEPHGVDWI